MVANGMYAFKPGGDIQPTCFHGVRQTSRVACECGCQAVEDTGLAQDTGNGLVELHNGMLRHTSVDLAIPGRGFDWKFERTYASQIIFDGPIGHSWELSHNRRLVLQPTGAVMRLDGYGRADRYDPTDGGFRSPPGYYTLLTPHRDGTFT